MRFSPTIAVPLLAWSLASGSAAGSITDEAQLFSPRALSLAEDSLAATSRVTGWRVEVRTVAALEGVEALRREAEAGAGRDGMDGLYVLIVRDGRRAEVVASPSARAAFTNEGTRSMVAAITDAFGANDFDRGLAEALDEARRMALARPRAARDVGVLDRAGMFSSDATIRASDGLSAYRRDNDRRVVIETLPSLDGRPVAEVLRDRFREAESPALLLLLIKSERRAFAAPDPAAAIPGSFAEPLVLGMLKTFDDNLGIRQANRGLNAVVNQVRSHNRVRTSLPIAAMPGGGSPANPHSGRGDRGGRDSGRTLVIRPLASVDDPGTPPLGPLAVAPTTPWTQRLPLYLGGSLIGAGLLWGLGRLLVRPSSATSPAPGLPLATDPAKGAAPPGAGVTGVPRGPSSEGGFSRGAFGG